MMRPLALLVMATLAACGGSDPVERFDAPPSERLKSSVAISYGSVQVREVSLPSYASTEEISRQEPEGGFSSSVALLWADDPVRAITLDVARMLREVTGARVAPDPWPYQSRPDVIVDIRFEDLLPTSDGQYLASGLYFVAPDEETNGREHAHAFSLTVPIEETDNLQSLAAARSTIVGELVLDIARSALR